MQTYQIEVSISRQEDGLWRAEAPVLPGCFVDAETLEEAIRDIQEAIRFFVASYRKHGDPLPPGLHAVASDAPHSLKLSVTVP